MAMFALIKDGIVQNAIIAESIEISEQFPGYEVIEFFNENRAKPGGTYDASINKFIDPSPFPSWTLDSDHKWQAPVEEPIDGKEHEWNEDSLSWVEIIIQ